MVKMISYHGRFIVSHAVSMQHVNHNSKVETGISSHHCHKSPPAIAYSHISTIRRHTIEALTVSRPFHSIPQCDAFSIV